MSKNYRYVLILVIHWIFISNIQIAYRKSINAYLSPFILKWVQNRKKIIEPRLLAKENKVLSIIL